MFKNLLIKFINYDDDDDDDDYYYYDDDDDDDDDDDYYDDDDDDDDDYYYYYYYYYASHAQHIALKAAIVLLATVLQKPSMKSKAKDHQECLTKRLALWKEGEIESLLRKGRSIHYCCCQRRNTYDLSASRDETLRFEGNKILFSPRDQPISDLLYIKTNGSNRWKTNNRFIAK